MGVEAGVELAGARGLAALLVAAFTRAGGFGVGTTEPLEELALSAGALVVAGGTDVVLAADSVRRCKILGKAMIPTRTSNAAKSGTT